MSSTSPPLETLEQKHLVMRRENPEACQLSSQELLDMHELSHYGFQLPDYLKRFSAVVDEPEGSPH